MTLKYQKLEDYNHNEMHDQLKLIFNDLCICPNYNKPDFVLFNVFQAFT